MPFKTKEKVLVLYTFYREILAHTRTALPIYTLLRTMTYNLYMENAPAEQKGNVRLYIISGQQSFNLTSSIRLCWLWKLYIF